MYYTDISKAAIKSKNKATKIAKTHPCFLGGSVKSYVTIEYDVFWLQVYSYSYIGYCAWLRHIFQLL